MPYDMSRGGRREWDAKKTGCNGIRMVETSSVNKGCGLFNPQTSEIGTGSLFGMTRWYGGAPPR